MIAYFEKSLSGSIIIGMTKDDIIDYPIVIPQSYYIKRFHNIVSDLFKSKKIRLSENKDLSQVRDFLLPMLMNGQIKIEA